MIVWPNVMSGQHSLTPLTQHVATIRTMHYTTHTAAHNPGQNDAFTYRDIHVTYRMTSYSSLFFLFSPGISQESLRSICTIRWKWTKWKMTNWTDDDASAQTVICTRHRKQRSLENWEIVLDFTKWTIDKTTMYSPFDCDINLNKMQSETDGQRANECNRVLLKRLTLVKIWCLIGYL